MGVIDKVKNLHCITNLNLITSKPQVQYSSGQWCKDDDFKFGCCRSETENCPGASKNEFPHLVGKVPHQARSEPVASWIPELSSTAAAPRPTIESTGCRETASSQLELIWSWTWSPHTLSALLFFNPRLGHHYEREQTISWRAASGSCKKRPLPKGERDNSKKNIFFSFYLCCMSWC